MTAPVWIRLTDTSGRGVLVRSAAVVSVCETAHVRTVETDRGRYVVTDTLDAIMDAARAMVAEWDAAGGGA